MASVTEPPQPNSPPRDPSNQEQVVDQQISQTRRAIKMVDFTAGMITLVIGVLGYLLTMAVLEHWVIPGGWSSGMRLALFAVLLVGVGVYSWRTFWPLLMQSINPIYAAQAIEHNSPSLKNSLLNLLLLRNNKQHMTRQVYQAIEQQAAQRLSQVKMESTVDRSIILRLGYILVALTAIAVLYRFLSPKDPISSIGRVLMPWSEIATPSRVEILNVTPGETKVAKGEQLTVTAEVHGLDPDEPVRLLYSTDDEQIVGQELLMTAAEGEAVFSCRVPGHVGGPNRSGSNHNAPNRSGSDGVQQNLTYWIEAGDARSSRYPVTVYSRPTLVVQRLRYEYPTYTGIPTKEVEHTGDIRAVEGTRVTIYAQANKPIKAAHIDFDADGRRDLLMNANDQLATATFPLELRDDRRTPIHKSYLLRFLTLEGNENQQPPKYQIDVQPDFSPEITLLLPEEPMLEVALNKEVQFEVEARDPDFALGHVVLIGKLGEKRLFQEKLLKQSNHTGRFVGKLHKTPEEMGLKVGDVLEYWGAAADNRRPKANLAYSVHRKIHVTGPWQGNPNEDKKEEEEGDNKQQPDQGEQGGEGESGQEGQKGGGEESSGGGEADDSEEQEGSEGDSSEMSEDGEKNNSGGKGGKGQQDSDEDSGEDGNSNEMTGDNAEDSNDQSGDQSGDESNNESSEGGTGGDQQGKVSSAGEDDGEAFDRMSDHFDKQDEDKQDGESGDDKNQTDENQTSEQGDSADGEGAKDNGKTESSSDAADGKIDSDQSGGEDEGNDGAAQAGEDASKGQDGPQDASQEKPPGESASADGETQPNSDSNETDDSTGEQEGDQQQDGNQEGQQQGDQNGEKQNNEMSPEQGEQGDGSESGDDQEAPNSDGSKQPQDKNSQGKNPGEKQGDSGQGGEKEGSDPASSAQDKTESDSQDGQGGDRSGDGEKGAGQQADDAGKGSEGENEAADDGKGKSSEQGDGETGDKAGDQKPADGETGESSGDQAGKGSEQSDKPGEQPDGEEQDGSQPPSQEKPPGESASADGDPTNTPPKPGDPQPNGNNSVSPENEVPPGDAANLEHAKKQTDLILERLEDQLNKKEVDQKLLDKLGWNQDELQQFVNRWKNLKSQAEKNSNEKTADQELNDALRSLGLNKNRRTGYKSKITKDQLRDLQDAYRGRVPLEFQDQIRSYHKGTATSQESE